MNYFEAKNKNKFSIQTRRRKTEEHGLTDSQDKSYICAKKAKLYGSSDSVFVCKTTEQTEINFFFQKNSLVSNNEIKRKSLDINKN